MATTNNPKVRFHRVSSLPSTGVEGHIYFVTGQDLLYTYNGSGWDVYGDKVTAVGKHYAPSGGSAATQTSGTAISWGGTAVTGITIDAAGHITGVTKGAIPANPNTDTHYTYSFSIQGNGTNAAVFSQSANQTLNLVGSGATTVTASSGKITISSTDTNTKVTAVGNHYTPSGGTAKSASGGTATSVTVASGSAIQVVSGVVCDAAGHVTGIQSKGLYAADTKNTAGSTDTSSKIFLIGATSQAANPQTYSDNEVFVTSGTLTMKEAQLGGATGPKVQYDSTNECIKFVF